MRSSAVALQDHQRRFGAAAFKLAHYPAIAALACTIPGTPPSSSVLCTELADYLRDKADVSETLPNKPTILSSKMRC
jgi:hypothetical protein